MEFERRAKTRLEKNVERARERLATDRGNGPKHQAYMMALIRLNEFMMQEAVLLHFQGDKRERVRT